MGHRQIAFWNPELANMPIKWQGKKQNNSNHLQVPPYTLPLYHQVTTIIQLAQSYNSNQSQGCDMAMTCVTGSLHAGVNSE